MVGGHTSQNCQSLVQFSWLPEVPLVPPKIAIIWSFFKNYHQLPEIPMVQPKTGITVKLNKNNQKLGYNTIFRCFWFIVGNFNLILSASIVIQHGTLTTWKQSIHYMVIFQIIIFAQGTPDWCNLKWLLYGHLSKIITSYPLVKPKTGIIWSHNDHQLSNIPLFQKLVDKKDTKRPYGYAKGKNEIREDILVGKTLRSSLHQ